MELWLLHWYGSRWCFKRTFVSWSHGVAELTFLKYLHKPYGLTFQSSFIINRILQIVITILMKTYCALQLYVKSYNFTCVQVPRMIEAIVTTMLCLLNHPDTRQYMCLHVDIEVSSYSLLWLARRCSCRVY